MRTVPNFGKIIYVYDAFGATVAEYAKGTEAAPPCRTCYLAKNHLGSTRIVMNGSGAVVARHDYLPFG